MTNKKMIENLPLNTLKRAFLAFLWITAVSQTIVSASEYIDIDEIVPGSEAYCLTVLEGTTIERFPLKVVDVVKNSEPGKDIFLVVGTGERFKHTGPVKGHSGSPVYIDGKLAGALSGAWSFSKDPLYMVTPIGEMLRAEKAADEHPSQTAAYSFDFSQPMDLANISDIYKKTVTDSGGLQKLLLVTSFPEHVCERISPLFENTSLVSVAASVSSGSSAAAKIEPGSVLAVPFITGDVIMAAVGTTTEVKDDQVFAFGHGFRGLAFGAVDLPMAAGNVHTVVSNMVISFKMTSPGPIMGAIRGNESTGIYGQIGAKPYMIPLNITVDRGRASRPGLKKTYNCMIASDRFFTPLILRSAIMGTCSMQGALGPEHRIEYKATVKLKDGKEIGFKNVSSGQGFSEMLIDAVSPIALLLNNPYKKTELASVDFNVKILPESITARILSLELSDTKVKPGQTITASVILSSFRAQKTMHTLDLQIPLNTKPQEYSITVTGGYGFETFLKKNAPYKFMALNRDSLVSSLQNILDIKRNMLYLTMPLPSSGIVIKNQPLPYLPKTKALILNDKKRTIPIAEQKHWVQKQKELDYIAVGSRTINITVEK